MTTTLQELLGTENPTEILKLINLLVTQKSNIDLSNLSSAGQAILDQKASINLNNLSAAGQAILDAKIEAEALTEQNGYIKFKLNGISKVVLQWGIQTNTQYGTYDKYFPVAFSNNKYIVLAGDWASPNYAPYAKAIAVDYSNLTTTRFVAHFSEHQPRGFAYIAIGV